MEMKNDYRRMVRLNPFESGSVFKCENGEWHEASSRVLIPLNQGLFLNVSWQLNTGLSCVLIPLNQGLFLNLIIIQFMTGNTVLIPLNQGLFLNTFTPYNPADIDSLNPFESGSVFKLVKLSP